MLHIFIFISKPAHQHHKTLHQYLYESVSILVYFFQSLNTGGSQVCLMTLTKHLSKQDFTGNLL